MLHSYGYTVLCAADADHAMVLFREHKDDIRLLFSDIGLPHVDGIDLCTQLREMKPGVPIILGSGYPTKDYKDRINALGPQAFLSKPYLIRDILQTVRNVLDGARVQLVA
jgi:two-component system cell cycle sensor histidine kinase/response regulator CckA